MIKEQYVHYWRNCVVCLQQRMLSNNQNMLTFMTKLYTMNFHISQKKKKKKKQKTKKKKKKKKTQSLFGPMEFVIKFDTVKSGWYIVFMTKH